MVFNFNASTNDALPVSPILFPVDLMRIEKSKLLTNVICVLFLLCSPLRPSFAIIVFNFNASLIDFAPLSPMALPVGFMRKEWIVDGYHLCCFFCIYHSD